MNKLKLITETSLNVQLKEQESGVLHIEGIFSSAECLNNNDRRYRKTTLEREVSRLQEKIGNKSLWGELGHPSTPEINPANIAILIESLNWNNNDLEGRAKVVDTDAGRNAKVLIKEGNLGISSRALGTVNETDKYVNEDLYVICYDLVVDPSNSPSWVKGIYEGKDFEFPAVKEPPEVFDIREARKIYNRHIWQVLESIERNL